MFYIFKEVVDKRATGLAGMVYATSKRQLKDAISEYCDHREVVCKPVKSGGSIAFNLDADYSKDSCLYPASDDSFDFSDAIHEDFNSGDDWSNVD